MKMKRKKIIALLTSFVLALGFCVQASAAEGDTTDISIRVTYGQTEARKMLPKINAFRKSDEAWHWDENSQNKVSLVGKLSTLTYDYDLEKIAMQRAEELAISFSHTRPNGTAWSTLPAKGTRRAENIAMGQKSAEAAFTTWLETEEKYDGQGHRRAMLDEGYKAVGIGHVIYGGQHFWVQEFSDEVSNSAETAANDAAGNAKVEILKASLTANVSASEQTKEIEFGATADVPTVTVTYQLGDKWQSEEKVFTPKWKTENPDIASVTDGRIIANAAGSTRLTANVEGTQVEVRVTVNQISLENATVTLDAEEYAYEGKDKAVTPKPTVTAAGRTLTEGTDYSLEYADHCKPGTATITIKGTGNYTGTCVKTFKIVCKHVFGEGVITKEATCKEEGEEEFTCELCDETETKVLPKLEHKAVEDPGKEATCTEDGITAGSHCAECGDVLLEQEVIPAKGHTWDEGVVKEEATCTKTGSKEFTCTVCGEKKTEELEKLPHTVVKDEAKESTCTEDGKTEGSHCSVCKEVLKAQEIIPKTGHVWDEGKVTKEPTHKTTGIKRFHCTKCGIGGTIILDKLEYRITKGAESVWKKDTKEGLTIVSDGAAADLVNVQVDGKVVDQKYYVVKAGATTVTLKPEYLNTLSAGKHTYLVNYKDGSVSTTFTVKGTASAAKAEENKNQIRTVQTGDTAPTTLLVGFMVFALVGAAVGVRMRKRGW